MKSLTTKQIFTIQLALRWMRTRKEQISYEFTGDARKSYQDDIKQIDSILDTLGEVVNMLLGSHDLTTIIEVKL